MGERGRRTADPGAAQSERRELVEKLERGFQQVRDSDEYRSFLDTVSRFHKYSISNTMLIWMQNPNDAEHIDSRPPLFLLCAQPVDFRHRPCG